jgi:hypothetical protein
MKKLSLLFVLFVTFFWLGCEKDEFSSDDLIQQSQSSIEKGAKENIKSLKATGEIEVEYLNNSGGEMSGELKYATVVFNAHEANKKNAAKGDITIIMTNSYGITNREIIADVFDVGVDSETKEARFLALVISDIKTHDSEHEDGSDSDHDGGDSCGSDHDDSEHGGDGDSGHNMNGNNSRVGQTIAVKVIDGGTPGINGDEIHWKWFSPNHQRLPDVKGNTGWGQICQKYIAAGNLVVHIK